MKTLFRVLYIMLSISLLECTSFRPEEERMKLYNEILDQIITDNYYSYCIPSDEKTEKIHREYINGNLDQDTYSRIVDSLKAVRMKMKSKCVLDYIDELGFSYPDKRLNEEIISSIKGSLNDPFLIDYFNDTSVQSIIDTISVAAKLNSKDLVVNYLEIVPYAKEKSGSYGREMGVIGFSRVSFSKDVNKAIVYYEFNCGGKCGTGEVVFVERVSGKWKIITYKRIWDS